MKRSAKRVALAILSGLVFLAATSASAQQPNKANPLPSVDDKITVTADRAERPVESVGSSVTVITAEEIEIRRARHVADLLRTVPGLEVVRGGGSGQVTSVFLRGGSSSQTLVLVDGVRVNSATTGAYDFADLTTDQVEQIEIVRGPQSTLYGSEAMAGVIAITTRRGGDERQVNVLAETGDLGSQRWAISADGKAGNWDYSLVAGHQETGNVSAAALTTDALSAAIEDDPYESTTFAGRFGLALANEGRLELSLRSFDAEVQNDGFDFGSGKPVDAFGRVQEREATQGALRYQQKIGNRVEQTFVAGFQDDDLQGLDPNDPFSNFTIESSRVELTSQTDVRLSSNNVLTLGYTYEEREGGSVGSFDESVEIESFFVQDAWSVGDRIHFTLGGRHDDHSTFGSESTWRATVSWEASASTRIHASAGTGFKAPTLNDLYFPFFSNPDLLPETNTAYDIGLEQRFGDKVTLDVTFFDSEYEDLIVFDFATFTPQNLAEATASGTEISLALRPGPTWGINASYTILDSEDKATGAALPRRPEGRGVLDLFFKPGERWRGVATFLSVSDRVDNGGVPMDDYERLDLVLHYKMTRGLEPYVRAENVFDEEYEEVPGFLTPGSVWAFGLAARF